MIGAGSDVGADVNSGLFFVDRYGLSGLVSGLFPDVMGNGFGENDGYFDESADGAVTTSPGCLVYHFAYSFFLDCIGVAAAFVEHTADDSARTVIVVLHEVVTNQAGSTTGGKCFAGKFVHVDDPAIGVAHRYGAIHSVRPVGQYRLFHFVAVIWKKPAGSVVASPGQASAS